MSPEGAASQPVTEHWYHAVFSAAADAILILDDRRAIVEANPAAAAMLGVSAGALVGRPFEELLADDAEEIQRAWRELIAVGEVTREHRIGSRADARRVECTYRARVQADRHLCIARDITERRLLDEQVMQADKIESVGRLAGGIAQDFNNLLTTILGYTELLIAKRNADDPDRRDLEEIARAGQRAAGLTQQLLAFSRKQVLLPKDLDLNRTIAGLQGTLGRLIREDITLTCDLSDRPAVVRIDPNQIEQVVLNLVLNARDALPGGGHIRLETGLVSALQAGLPPGHRPPASEYVRLRVIDDGVGISDEARSHLFEPFFTTKAFGKGRGLGLASVYGIVGQSNGSISVESEPGRGTMFTMHFPAVPLAEQTEAEPRKVAERVPEGETILLVEDEDPVRTIISAALRRHGYQVIEASTPRGACDIFEQYPDQISLLLSGGVTPEMNGPSLAQRLVAVRPGLRVLFVSGDSNAAVPAFDSSNPNIGFLSKPFQVSTLIARVKELLGRPRCR